MGIQRNELMAFPVRAGGQSWGPVKGTAMAWWQVSEFASGWYFLNGIL